MKKIMSLLTVVAIILSMTIIGSFQSFASVPTLENLDITPQSTWTTYGNNKSTYTTGSLNLPDASTLTPAPYYLGWNFLFGARNNVQNYESNFNIKFTRSGNNFGADGRFYLVLRSKASNTAFWPNLSADNKKGYWINFYEHGFNFMMNNVVLKSVSLGSLSIVDGTNHLINVKVYDNDIGGVTIIFNIDGTVYLDYSTNSTDPILDYLGNPTSLVDRYTGGGNIQIFTDKAMIDISRFIPTEETLNILPLSNWAAVGANGMNYNSTTGELNLPVVSGAYPGAGYVYNNYLLGSRSDILNYNTRFNLKVTPPSTYTNNFGLNEAQGKLWISLRNTQLNTRFLTSSQQGYWIALNETGFNFYIDSYIIKYNVSLAGLKIADGNKHEFYLEVYNNDIGGVNVKLKIDGTLYLNYSNNATDPVLTYNGNPTTNLGTSRRTSPGSIQVFADNSNLVFSAPNTPTAVTSVINQIESLNIDSITTADTTAVNAVFTAYNALYTTDRALVTNFNKLTIALAALTPISAYSNIDASLPRIVLHGNNPSFGYIPDLNGENYGIGNSTVGHSISIPNVDFGTMGAQSVTIQATTYNADEKYGVYLDNNFSGSPIATFTIPVAGKDIGMDLTKAQTAIADLTETNITGIHTVNIKWITSSASFFSVCFTEKTINYGNYKINGLKITNVQPNSKVSDFRNSVSNGIGTTLEFKNGNSILGDNSIIGTGTVLNQYQNSTFVNSYIILIYGDVNGDGEIKLSDLVSIRNHLLETELLQGDFKLAGDLYGENEVTLNDLVGMMAYTSESGSINQNVQPADNTNGSVIYANGFVPMNDKNIKYQGRWIARENGEYDGYFESGLEFSFTGKSLSINLVSSCRLLIGIDGSTFQRYPTASGILSIAAGTLSDGEHTVKIYSDYQQSFPKINGFIIDIGARSIQKNYKPTIEFVGDSITVGYIGSGYTNSLVSSYGFKTGEQLRFSHNTVAYGGMAVVPGTGSPDSTGMVNRYFKLSEFVTGESNVPQWNTSNYVPDYLVINLGTNDITSTSDVFKSNYLSYLENLRACYPNTVIFVMTPFNGRHKDDISNVIQTRINSGDTSLIFIDSSSWITNDQTTDGLHPNIEAHNIIANNLTASIKSYLSN